MTFFEWLRLSSLRNWTKLKLDVNSWASSMHVHCAMHHVGQSYRPLHSIEWRIEFFAEDFTFILWVLIQTNCFHVVFQPSKVQSSREKFWNEGHQKKMPDVSARDASHSKCHFMLWTTEKHSALHQLYTHACKVYYRHQWWDNHL
jgi:hypothetical protein